MTADWPATELDRLLALTDPTPEQEQRLEQLLADQLLVTGDRRNGTDRRSPVDPELPAYDTFPLVVNIRRREMERRQDVRRRSERLARFLAAVQANPRLR